MQFVVNEHGNERKRKMEEKWVEGAYYKPGGYFWIFFGRGVPPSSPNSDPISDQKMSLFTPVFRSDL